MLGGSDDIKFERGGMHFNVHVPDEVPQGRLVESDERELESS